MKNDTTADPGLAESTESQSLSLRLWISLARAHAAVLAHAQADAARHGLTLAEFGVLEALLHKGPLTQGAAQRAILVSSGGITFLVDRLVTRGLVERRPHPTDRRVRLAALTAKGEQLVRSIFPDHAARIKGAVAGLGKKEKREAIRLLQALGKHAAALAEPAAVPEEP
jgi:MarR family transcriptional regulator, 2-MHQ and catechol-resistance regulon repressor